MFFTILNYIAIVAVICFIVSLIRALVILKRRRALQDLENDAADLSHTPVLFATSKGLFIRKVRRQQKDTKNILRNKSKCAVGVETEYLIQYCDNHCANCHVCK